MHRLSRSLIFAIALIGPTALQAACFASYKAKRDDPLKLHFGVAEIAGDDCSVAGANEELGPRLKKDGWKLLSIVEIVPQEKLEEVQERAGQYFLRY